MIIIGESIMCLAVPAKIVRLTNNHEVALCDFIGVAKEVNVSLIANPVPGDWVIVHVGFALNRIDNKEAQKTQELLQNLASRNELNC